ncbi:hypothetical protein DK842_11740 [Chromobacterium phragmitis]|uniref:DUF3304 domain-containing protein n=1 Tax=Chromobacterium phragmitis TaxID=2202141 RepID=UPI000DECC8D3|nr:DUF3304 domain-containing protein [Chromobacterium phragmitis]AXE30510.1 hypothetical protein DK842_11740 [Chromobacterium phragmitis]
MSLAQASFFRWMVPLLACLMLGACAGMGGQLGASMTVVNYSGKGYDWVAVAQPQTPEQADAAEMIGPYGAGGIMCCVNLPAKWQPGMQLVVQTKDGTKAKTVAEWSKENIPLKLRTVEVPRYEASDVGTVWVQLLPDDKVALVVSRYDPSNANWPGAIKGWPKPSLEYRRQLWDQEMRLLTKDLADFQAQIKKDSANRQTYQDAIDSVQNQINRLGGRP